MKSIVYKAAIDFQRLNVRFPYFCILLRFKEVERTGLEPVTSALSKQRSEPTELTFRGELKIKN